MQLLPKQENRTLRWNDFSTWSEVKALAWSTSTAVNLFNTLKLGRGALGRTLGFRVDMTSINVTTLVIGDVTLEYNTGEF